MMGDTHPRSDSHPKPQGDSHPRRLTNSRQGDGVVGIFATVESPVISNVSALRLNIQVTIDQKKLMLS